MYLLQIRTESSSQCFTFLNYFIINFFVCMYTNTVCIKVCVCVQLGKQKLGEEYWVIWWQLVLLCSNPNCPYDRTTQNLEPLRVEWNIKLFKRQVFIIHSHGLLDALFPNWNSPSGIAKVEQYSNNFFTSPARFYWRTAYPSQRDHFIHSLARRELPEGSSWSKAYSVMLRCQF